MLLTFSGNKWFNQVRWVKLRTFQGYVAIVLLVNYRVTYKNCIVSYDDFHRKLIARKPTFKILQVNIIDKEVEQLK